MIILQLFKWAAIAVCSVIAVLAALILLAIAVWALMVLTEHWRYRLSRHRTLKAKEKVHALKAKFAGAISSPGRGNPLMRGFSIPLSRFEKAVETLDKRFESLQHANDVRHGPYTRSEWKHLRRDVKRVLRRGKQLEYFLEAPDARDGIWPFVEGHSAIYADHNYEGRQPERIGESSPFTDEPASSPARVPVRPRRAQRNFGVGRGALDENVVPSLEERRQAQVSQAEQGVVTVLKPAQRKPRVDGFYDKTGKVLPFRRPASLDIKA